MLIFLLSLSLSHWSFDRSHMMSVSVCRMFTSRALSTHKTLFSSSINASMSLACFHRADGGHFPFDAYSFFVLSRGYTIARQWSQFIRTIIVHTSVSTNRSPSSLARSLFIQGGEKQTQSRLSVFSLLVKISWHRSSSERFLSVRSGEAIVSTGLMI